MGTLKELIDALPGGVMSEKHACMYVWKVVKALGYLHNNLLVIHRDINFNNVLIGADDGWPVVGEVYLCTAAQDHPCKLCRCRLPTSVQPC